MRGIACTSLIWLSVFMCGCGDAKPAAIPLADVPQGVGDVPESQRSIAGVTVSVNGPGAREVPADGARIRGEVNDADDVQVALDEIAALVEVPLPNTMDVARKARRKRNLKTVELASRVLRLSLDDSNRREQFQEGIRRFLEARFQLAIDGSEDDVEQLYADVQALNDRDPQSESAADGIYYLARFAHTKARLLGDKDPVWLENFARWAREFANRFPQQQDRAASLLFGAGRSCEMHATDAVSDAGRSKLMTDAKLCYTALLAEAYANTSQGQEAAAILRRLSLPGTRLSQFAGPTLDGGYLTAEELVGRLTVIYFWDTQNSEFANELVPLLTKSRGPDAERLRFVGVNMDEDVAAVRQFVKTKSIPGHQIFFPDEKLRSWNSPLIRFWGVSKIPTVWIVDDSGVVIAVDVPPSDLAGKLRLQPHQR